MKHLIFEIEGYCSLVIIYIIYTYTIFFFSRLDRSGFCLTAFRCLVGLWQTSLHLSFAELLRVAKVWQTFLFFVRQTAFSIIFPDFHWTLRIIKAASDVIAEHFDQYEVEDLRPGTGSGKAEWYFHILRRERHAVRREKIRKDEKRGVVALQTHCVSSCKFWRSASCYSEALTAQHTCTDSTQRRHFHYAWKRGMACIMLGCSMMFLSMFGCYPWNCH